MFCFSIKLKKHDCNFGVTGNVVGTGADRQVFSQLFQVLPVFR